MKENRKRFKLWVILATMAMCLQLLPANVLAEEVITYSVTFNSMEGSTVEAYADVNEGDTIEAPTAPTKDGYTFGGWYKEAEMTNAWDFATDTVSANTTLYAQWAAASPSYTMSFNVNSGTEVSAISNIASGSNIEAPTAPTKDGYTFEGWYKESELTNAWDFATDTVSADTTLYAKWTAASASDIKSLSLDNYKVAETTPVDVLITADDTYKGSLSDYASQLSETLASQGITADDVRIKTVNTAINLSNFYDWYVFDHYYSPDSADDGTVPENWNNYSGRHPYYYWQETSTGIPRQYLLAAESQLHDKVWGEYEILLNTCETDSSDLQSILFKNAYEKLGDEAKAAADVLVLQAISKDFGITFNNDDEFMLYIRNMVTGWYYPGKRYDELTDEEKANKDMVNYINNYYTSQFFSYYSKIEYESLDTEAKAAADVLILQAISKDFGVTFNNYDEYTIYIRNMVTSWYYPGKIYDELTDEEKANIYLQNNIDNYCNNNYFSQYYTEAVYNALSSNEKKALADKYLMENCVKPDYVSNHSEEAYTALTDIEKAALLKAYKDSWLDNVFSEYNYLSEGESFASITDARKTEIINKFYFDYYISQSEDIYYYVDANYDVDSFYITDITSDGALDAIYNRDKHIYTSIDENNNASITFLGYSEPAYKDFLIYPTTIENKKEVSFDIDASKVKTHTLEGAGFLINSGIDSDGDIHGYILFYQFDDPTYGTVYLLKINDNVTAEALHNSDNSSILDYATEVTSQDFTVDSKSMKKNISVTVTPQSVTCIDTDYTSDGELGQASELFDGAIELDSTGYNGFGPITSYTSHGCEQLSAFTFSHLKMSYQSSSVEGLRSATYIDEAKKVYIVLTGSPETDIPSDLNAYNELLTRLGNDRIFYVTTGGDITVTANAGNGLNISESNTPVADAANYIAKLSTEEITWANTSLRHGDDLLPVAIFDITDSDEKQIIFLDRTSIDESGLTLKFGNTNKSAALATGAGDLTYIYTVYDPSGNIMTLGGTDNNELTLNNTAALGNYTFALEVNDDVNTSATATRVLNVTENYTVTFNTNGGSEVTAINNIASGSTITAPSAPTNSGYNFAGWYKEAALINAWDFKTDTVVANITLYAKWTAAPISYTVSFDVDGGTEIIGLNNIASGSTITSPAAPTKVGYNFVGWYKESELTNAWNFTSDTVTANTTLYAKWKVAYELTVPDFSIASQSIDDGSSKTITLAASGSKVMINGVELTGATINYSFTFAEDYADIAVLDGAALTLKAPGDGITKTVKVKATATWADGEANLTANRIVSFTVSNAGKPTCTCIVTAPIFTISNQTIPYNSENKSLTLAASGAKVIGSCKISGHTSSTVTYSYAIISGGKDAKGTTIAKIDNNILTLNPGIAGTYNITIQAIASANSKTGSKTVSFTVIKEPSPAAATCTCTLTTPVLTSSTLTIASGASEATLDLNGKLTPATLAGDCQVDGHATSEVNHIYTIKSGSSYNTAGARLNGTTLTVTRAGTVTVIVTSIANSKTSASTEATFTVSDADISAVEDLIYALPVTNSDTASNDDTEISTAEAQIKAAKDAFEDLSVGEKEQVSAAKRTKLDALISRLGLLQTNIDASKAGGTITATGLETAVNTASDITAGNNVNITLAVEAEDNISQTDEIAADSNIILASADSTETLSSAFNIRLLKTVTETTGNITTEPVLEADAPVYVTMEVPVALRGGSDYKIYHVHTNTDGSKDLETIVATYNSNANPPTISFWIRKFSTIKISYTPATNGENGHGGGSSSSGSQTGANGVNILVNGKVENYGTLKNTRNGTKTIATVTVNEEKLAARLLEEGNNAIVTIPINTESDVVIGELNGQMIKNMENQQAVVEIKTENATYKLPAQLININDVAKHFGQNLELKGVKVQIEIAKTEAAAVEAAANAAKKGEFTIIAPAVDFNVKCSYGNQTVTLSKFNSYVERTIAIPAGVDPGKITTGIIVEPDGSVRHVPTRISVIDNKYYAIINSLTDSTYTVIWHPVEFTDAANHWSKAEVNDMGSRMVISGVGENLFEPDRDITRAEFAAIIVRALGLKPGIGSNNFTDVEASEWYSDYIKTAYDYQLITGYSHDIFAPQDKITREEAMAMIARAMNITGLKADLTNDNVNTLLAAFTDGNRPADWAKKNVAACIKVQIVSGRDGNRIAPQDNITRAEVAAIVQRLLQKSGLI